MVVNVPNRVENYWQFVLQKEIVSSDLNTWWTVILSTSWNWLIVEEIIVWNDWIWIAWPTSIIISSTSWKTIMQVSTSWWTNIWPNWSIDFKNALVGRKCFLDINEWVTLIAIGSNWTWAWKAKITFVLRKCDNSSSAQIV